MRTERGLGLQGRVHLNIGGCEFVSHLWLDSTRLERGLKFSDTIFNFICGVVNALISCLFHLLSLAVFELELALLTLLLVCHVLLPVFDTLLEPFLHEASVPLKFVDLSASDLLLAEPTCLLIGSVCLLGFFILTISLFLELGKVTLHVRLLLGLVESLETLLEELSGHGLIGLLGRAELESRLGIAVFAGLSQDGDVCWRVYLLEDHFELIKHPECETALLLHDLVDALRVKLDVQVPQSWFEPLKVLNL